MIKIARTNEAIVGRGAYSEGEYASGLQYAGAGRIRDRALFRPPVLEAPKPADTREGDEACEPARRISCGVRRDWGGRVRPCSSRSFSMNLLRNAGGKFL